MSIRHCIAGVVLVVIGGLAASGQDQAKSNSDGDSPHLPTLTDVRIQDERIRALEALQEQIRADVEKAKHARARLNQPRAAWHFDRPGTIHEGPQPAPVSSERGQVFAYPLQSEARPVIATPITQGASNTFVPASQGPDMPAVQPTSDQPPPPVDIRTARERTKTKLEAAIKMRNVYDEKIGTLKSTLSAMEVAVGTSGPERKLVAPPLSPSPVGRYQFVDRDRLPDGKQAGLMYDTTTGHCWSLVGSEWKDLGLPMQPVAKPYYYGNPTPQSWEDRATGGPPANAANAPSPDLNIKPVPSPVDAGKVPAPIRGEPVLDSVKPATPAPGEVFKKRGVE